MPAVIVSTYLFKHTGPSSNMRAEDTTEQPPTAAALVIENGSVLLIREEDSVGEEGPVYGLPGGVVEAHESQKETVVRELKEETGLITQKNKLVQVPYQFAASAPDTNVLQLPFTVYVCLQYWGELNASKTSVPLWIPLSELSHYPLLPTVDTAIHEGARWLQEQT